MRQRMAVPTLFFLLMVILAIPVLLSGCSAKADAQPDGNLPVLVIGSDEYEPFNYADDDGNYVGVGVELAQEACRRMGYQPEFRQVVWEKKDEYLTNGEVDCLWGCFSMNGREELYTWAGPYMDSWQVAVVREDSDLHKLSDLEGKRVAVQATGEAESVLLQRTDPQVPEVGAVYCLSTLEELFAALRKGYCDAIAGHEAALQYYMDLAPEQYRVLDEKICISHVGVAFLKGTHTGLAAQLTQTLDDMAADGTIAEIAAKYHVQAAGGNA